MHGRSKKMRSYSFISGGITPEISSRPPLIFRCIVQFIMIGVVGKMNPGPIYKTHGIHVWYIYLHLPSKASPMQVNIFHAYMGPMEMTWTPTPPQIIIKSILCQRTWPTVHNLPPLNQTNHNKSISSQKNGSSKKLTVLVLLRHFHLLFVVFVSIKEGVLGFLPHIWDVFPPVRWRCHACCGALERPSVNCTSAKGKQTWHQRLFLVPLKGGSI